MENCGMDARVGKGRFWVQWVNLLFVVTAAADQSVTLAWDPNSEPDLAGYVLYYGTNSGDYRTSIQVGNVTLVTVTGLTESVTYYFAVTAVNQFGAESGFSNEVGYTVPACRGGPADVAPRGRGGDGKVDLVDWVQVGLFCTGLEVSTNRCEFGKADCWPKGDGDGVIDFCDWGQAGLYAAHLDASNGPVKPIASSASSFVPAPGKTLLSVCGAVFENGKINTLEVVLNSQGDENALGFSLKFDPGLLRCVSVQSPSTNGGNQLFFVVNSNYVAEGLLGVVMALPPGQSFAAGATTILQITFLAAQSGAVSTPVRLVDAPVPRQAVGWAADELQAGSVDGIVYLAKEAGGAIQSMRLDSNHRLVLTMVSAPGAVGNLQVSTNLADWRSIAVLTNQNGLLEYTASPDERERFYRWAQP